MNHILPKVRVLIRNATPIRTQLSTRPPGTSAVSSSIVQSSASAKDLLITAAWFGLVTGLVEGIALWGLQQIGWLSGSLTFLGFSAEVVWIATLFDLLVYCALGLALALAAWLVPQLPVTRVSVILFAFLTFYDWLALPLAGRVRIWAVPVPAIGLTIQFGRWFHKHQHAAVRFWRKSVPWLSALALLALVGIQGGFWLAERIGVARLPTAASDLPNILVIVVDTLRADHVSGYGYERPTTPNLDRIAQQGVLFESAFSTSSWTEPSHASMLTGRYLYEHGADLYKRLDDRYPTIAEALQARGYRTAVFSANFRVFCRRLGFGRGFHHFEDYYRSPDNIVINSFYGRMVEAYLLHYGFGLEDEIGRRWADAINRAALGWIDRDQERPFFVFINYYDVHDPYVPPQPYRNMFSQMENPGGLVNSYWGVDHIYVPMTPDQLQGEIDAYDGAIAYVDHHIDQLMDELEARGLAENTLVVITSDHGESFGEHGLLQHTNSLYREVIHVPLIIWWPGHVPEGVRVDESVTIAALPATLLDLATGDEQTLFPGPPLGRLWDASKTISDWPYPIAELAHHPWSPVQNPSAHGDIRSALSSKWHYITHEKFGEELYDWPTDLQETLNLADRPDMQTVTEQFKTYLEGLVSHAGSIHSSLVPVD
jgi:arylsulfatase A-like enzyme